MKDEDARRGGKRGGEMCESLFAGCEKIPILTLYWDAVLSNTLASMAACDHT